MKKLILGLLLLLSAVSNASSEGADADAQSALLNQLSGVYHLLNSEGGLADIDNMLYPSKYKVQLRLENGCLVEEIQHAKQALIRYKDLKRVTCNKSGPTERDFKWADDNQSALLSYSTHRDNSAFKIDVATKQIIVRTGYTWSQSGLMMLVVPTYFSGESVTERVFSMNDGVVRYVEKSRMNKSRSAPANFVKVGDEL